MLEGAGDVLSRSGLSRWEKHKIVLLYVGIGMATIIGFASLVVLSKVSILLASYGILAYVLGLRHGVDADHITTIDNVTVKLMEDEERPLTVGTWFSLGHSTIVVGLIIALLAAYRTTALAVPILQSLGSVLGSAISGFFLILLGLMNTQSAADTYSIFRGVETGAISPKELSKMIERNGFLNRHFQRLFKLVSKPWKVYPIGVLFGLGFDTASEIVLLALALGIVTSASTPFWTTLILPFLFTCGMVLVDTTDGIAMRATYGWTRDKPLRKIYLNLTLTIVSLLAALAIGGVLVLQGLSDEFGLRGPFWSSIGSLDFAMIGYAIIGLLVVTWFVSVLYWKHKHYDEYS